MQGGTIGVESTGIEGQGSVFYFTLPVSHPPVKREQPAIKTPKMEPTVLVLSSNLSSCDRLCALLEQRGIRVQTALMAQGDDLQAHLTESVPEAIVLDVSISADPGWKTLKAIREGQYAPGTPVMFYTASPDGEALLGLDYLSKPIELAELKQALDQYWFMSDPAHPQRTFLVVDDEPNTLEMHARLVQSHSPSNRVLRASNGREALTILGQEKIDLVLLDLQMPDMDGFDVLEGMRTRESMREVPVIVVTGKELTEADMVRLNQGVAVVLKKGLFGIDETLAHIRQRWSVNIS
jgi:CheY-like chemotaxis protein